MAEPFSVPHDVVARLGNGDPRVAGSVLRRMFGVSPENPTIVPADVVRELGGGDINAGRKVLARFAQLLRQVYRYEPPPRYAKGGAVGKISKADAGYEPCGE